MKPSRLVLGALLLAIIVTQPSCGPWPSPAVRVWQDVVTLRTYAEGEPDPNPPFDLFSSTRFNYPYTMRTRLSDKAAPRAWRRLNLENEYLKISVLPDLGGHLYSAVDKATGREMFFANPSLKLAQVAYRGAWASYGIEFNFPVSHNWVTVSPVDFASRTNADGSASIVVGNVDLVYGMQWRVELTLRPGRAALEQRTTLYNRSDVRHRFYWWTNAAVQVWDDSQLVYPMRYTAGHGFADVDTWPVNTAGVDLSRPGNHRSGPVSLFSHGSREPFMGIYHPRTGSGVVHYSSGADLPAKKMWSWGCDADGLEWRRAMSDNESAVVEVQAGLFRNQETYAFLEPQESIRFVEYWLPVRRIGGISRANADAVVHIARTSAAAGGEGLAVGLNLARAVRRGRLTVLDGTRVVAQEALSLTPSETLSRTFPVRGTRPLTVRLSDADGRVLIEHTEGRYDADPSGPVTLGPQAAHVPPPADARREEDSLEVGRNQELEGKLLKAYDTYAEALARFPDSFGLAKALGRLAVGLKRFDEAIPRLEQAAARVTNDPEVQYSLGCARAAIGDPARSRDAFEAAAHVRAWRAPAASQLARLEARSGRNARALEWITQAVRSDPDAIRAGAFEVILLRRAGQASRARERLSYWSGLDSTNGTLRLERVRLGTPDPSLWTHLAGDPQRVLDIAIDYMELGAWNDAIDVLAREYPIGAAVFSEPGALAPQRHPEIAYYRGYCREQLHASGRADFDAASRMSTRYVFPQRAWSFPVLKRAVEANPADATARFLLGSLYLSGGMADRATEQWEAAVRLGARIPTLHRNVGMTVLHALGQPDRAAAILGAGLDADPTNADVYLALDQALSLTGRPAAERLRVIDRYPDATALPTALVFERAIGLVEAGRPAEAERALLGRFFPREEFGTNVRQVYVEVKQQQALALARQRRCPEAVAIVQNLGGRVPGVPFTDSGLSAFVESARADYLSGEVFAACGQAASARASWQRAAARTDAYPYPNLAFGWAARQRLGGAMDAGTRTRLEDATRAWERRLVIGTNFPGPNAVGRGLLLRAVGREKDAVACFREALLLPDQLLSHYLAREALAKQGAK